MSPNDPLSQLVAALRQGTADGSIVWQKVGSQGDAFIARRKSGTVTLRGQRAPGMGYSLTYGNTTATLTVKDATGKTIEKYDAISSSPLSGGAAAALLSATGAPDDQILALYRDVRERLTKAEATMRALSQEFEGPE